MLAVVLMKTFDNCVNNYVTRLQRAQELLLRTTVYN